MTCPACVIERTHGVAVVAEHHECAAVVAEHHECAAEQPLPVAGAGPAIVDLVLADLNAIAVGVFRYPADNAFRSRP